MSALVIDTSSWIDYFAGASRRGLLIEEALEEGRVYLSPIVAAELLSGRLTQERRHQLEDFLGDLPLIGTELDHWFRVGHLRQRLAGKGLSVSTPDAHVAQCALDLDSELLSEDAIFRRVARESRLRLSH